MKKLQEIKPILATHKPVIQKKYKVKKIGIFGSYLRGKQGKRGDSVSILPIFKAK